MLYNRQAFAEPEAIRQAHGYIGFAATAGAFAGIENQIDAEHLTDDEIVIEGRLCGTHIGEFQGFAPSGRAVELPFVAVNVTTFVKFTMPPTAVAVPVVAV